jgi:hypothetical protein
MMKFGFSPVHIWYPRTAGGVDSDTTAAIKKFGGIVFGTCFPTFSPLLAVRGVEYEPHLHNHLYPKKFLAEERRRIA